MNYKIHLITSKFLTFYVQEHPNMVNKLCGNRLQWATNEHRNIVKFTAFNSPTLLKRDHASFSIMNIFKDRKDIKLYLEVESRSLFQHVLEFPINEQLPVFNLCTIFCCYSIAYFSYSSIGLSTLTLFVCN